MKKALILFAKPSVERQLADPVRLTELLQAAGELKVSWAYFDDLVYQVDNQSVGLLDTRNQRQITDYDIVYFRYWGAQEGHAIAAARICHLLNVPFIDEEVLRRGSQNKMTQYVNLYEAGVAIPKTLMAHGQLLVGHYAEYGFDFPFIMKDKGGTRGESNYLVKTLDDMKKIVADSPDITFVLQEFIANVGDYRVIVMGDEVTLIIYRTASGGSHLNNTSQGGSAQIVPLETLPASVRNDCVKASQFYGRNFTGVDIVKSETDGEYYCFEVNRAPQIDHASFEQEKASLLAAYLTKVAK
jgi:glutathione synthase/RimK-type ligase-like ATP-grasp enzyme